MTLPDVDLDPESRSAAPYAREPAGEAAPRRRGLLSPKDALQPERLPPPPKAKKRRPGLLAAISGFLTFLLVGFFVAGFMLVSMQRKIREPGPLTADKVLYIASGTDVPDIIAQLETEGVISSSMLMNVAVVVEGARSKLKAGEYQFKQSASLQEVMDTLVSGKQILHPVTVPEGLTSEQIVGRLRDNEFLTGDVREMPKEGTLLPETYKISRSDTRVGLVRKMQDDQRKLIDQIWARRSPDLPIKTPYELVTLASIVERETGKADERPRVASVFINRLNKRMRLQSDPTIVYGLVQGRGTLGRGILRSEVDKWTPYNTYQIDGLPPGPIANPGRAALEAVANPSRTNDLYFVADGTGGHVFASTLDEHQRNVVRWRQIEKDAKDRGAAAAAGDVDKAPAPNMSIPAGAPGVPGAAPVRPGPRGDLAPDAVFGALSQTAGVADDDLTPRLQAAPPKPYRLVANPFGDNTSRRTIARIVADRDLARSQPAPTPIVAAATLPAPGEGGSIGELAYGPDIDSLGIQIRGVPGRSNLLDGPAEPDTAGSVNLATYPVGAERRADQRATAARLGLPSESDSLPPPSQDERSQDYRSQDYRSQDFRSQDNLPAPRRVRVIDASEGTPLDPLRNKGWDLSHVQTIPSLTIR